MEEAQHFDYQLGMIQEENLTENELRVYRSCLDKGLTKYDNHIRD